MPIKDEVSWNCLISGYVKAGDLRSAEIMFEAMPVKSVVTCTAIISGYASNGDVEAARKMFDRMGDKRNSVTWNAMIAGYVNKSIFDEALSLFHLMLLDGKCRPDQGFNLGRMIHGDVLKMGFDVSNVFVGNSLLSFYSKCGLDGVDYACKVFDDMYVTGRDVVSW
nr:hypothetical protein [Tanacetum cinerariifolium]